MKNEKHVALAAQVYHEWKINNYGVYRLDQRDADRLLEIVAAALSQVETEALASKVVGYNETTLLNELDKIIKSEMTITEDEPSDDVRAAFVAGFYFYKFHLTLAPSEQVIRVPKKPDNEPYGLKRHDEICDELENKQSFSETAVVNASCGIWKAIESERDFLLEAIKRLNPQARIEESNE